MKRVGRAGLGLALAAALGACEGMTGPGSQFGPFRVSVSVTPARVTPQDSVLIHVVLRNVEATPFSFGDDVVPTCPILLTVQSRSGVVAGSPNPCTSPGATMPRPPVTIQPGDSLAGTVWWPGAAAEPGGGLSPGTYDVVAAIWWSHFQISHRVAVTSFAVTAP